MKTFTTTTQKFFMISSFFVLFFALPINILANEEVFEEDTYEDHGLTPYPEKIFDMQNTQAYNYFRSESELEDIRDTLEDVIVDRKWESLNVYEELESCTEYTQRDPGNTKSLYREIVGNAALMEEILMKQPAGSIGVNFDDILFWNLYNQFANIEQNIQREKTLCEKEEDRLVVKEKYVALQREMKFLQTFRKKDFENYHWVGDQKAMDSTLESFYETVEEADAIYISMTDEDQEEKIDQLNTLYGNLQAHFSNTQLALDGANFNADENLALKFAPENNEESEIVANVSENNSSEKSEEDSGKVLGATDNKKRNSMNLFHILMRIGILLTAVLYGAITWQKRSENSEEM